MKASFILLVLVTLMLRMNGSGQSAQLPPASDMKTIGLIGGTSWYSPFHGTLVYPTILDEWSAILP